MADALKLLISKSTKLTGQMIIGWPIGTEIVLISDRGQVTAIDFAHYSWDDEYPQRQDRAFNAVHSLLMTDPRLTTKRTTTSPVKTVTMFTGVRTPDVHHPEHPLVSTGTIVQKLEAFQEEATCEVDPQAVIDALLRIEAPEGNTLRHKREQQELREEINSALSRQGIATI